jgi:O-succinylbenzoic acid--CoA ligase
VQKRLITLTAASPDEVAGTLLPALAAALDGGPALTALPADRAERDRALIATRPEQRLEHSDEEIALVVPTSGSTGEPKAALLSARALRASATATHDFLGGPGQWLLALPATHIAGLQVLIRATLAGIRPVLLDLREGFHPTELADALAAMDPGRRYVSLVPTQLRRVLDIGGPVAEALAAVDAVLLGGAAAPIALREQAADAGIPVVTTYGMTETCGGCVYDGQPLSDVDIDLAPSGRISIGGPVLFSGYRLRPDLTAEVLAGGRFRTSDVGQWSATGGLEVIGRADDVIITGGVNVAPAAVEAALASCPGVSESAVTGVSHPEWGQVVIAVLTPHATEPTPTLAAVRAHVSGLLGPHAAPRAIAFLPELPRLPLGKIDRQAIATIATQLGQTVDS